MDKIKEKLKNLLDNAALPVWGFTNPDISVIRRDEVEAIFKTQIKEMEEEHIKCLDDLVEQNNMVLEETLKEIEAELIKDHIMSRQEIIEIFKKI